MMKLSLMMGQVFQDETGCIVQDRLDNDETLKIFVSAIHIIGMFDKIVGGQNLTFFCSVGFSAFQKGRIICCAKNG